MGCDIHLYREKRVNGVWLTADKWTPYDYGEDEKGIRVSYEDRAYTGRNYNLFALLSKGTRGEHAFSLEPRGMPFNASEEVLREAVSWDGDGHSHSYLYLFELREMAAFLKEKTVAVSGMKDRSELAALQESIASGSPDWSLLYPYCGWSSASTYDEFEVDVPADFMVGECLQRIIGSFEGIDGDMHRIVFFFDN